MKRTKGPAVAAMARTGLSKTLSKCDDYETLVYVLEALPFPVEKNGAVDESQVTAAVLKRLGGLLGQV